MTDESTVRAIVQDWAKAVEAGNRKAILANHADDLLMIDFVNIVRGLDTYDKTWDFFYDKPRGSIVYRIGEMQVTVGDTVAFVSSQMHCDGTSAGSLDFRLTTGLRKRADGWTIVHEHHSVPTIEERFIGPQ